MKKLLFLVVAIGAVYLIKPELFPLLNSGNGAFDDNGNPKSLLFTTSMCKKPCEQARKLLKTRSISFEEVAVDLNEENQIRWREYSKYNDLPFLITGNERTYGYQLTKIVSNLAVNYGDAVLSIAERRYLKKHFNSDGSPKIVMYGASWCPHCARLRGELKEEGLVLLC